MILDQDDVYTQKDCFSTLYYEIEKNHLDFLGFASLFRRKFKLRHKKMIHHYFETSIIYKPKIYSSMFYHRKDGGIDLNIDVLWCYIFKSELFKNVIKQIDDKFLNSKMNCHEDFLLLFLLSKNANSFKNIKRIFYFHIKWKYFRDKKVKFSVKEKYKDNDNLKCNSFLNSIEFFLIKTDDSYYDKEIASHTLKRYYLNNNCRNNIYARERGIKVSKLFLENQFISNDTKNEILLFLNESKSINNYK